MKKPVRYKYKTAEQKDDFIAKCIVVVFVLLIILFSTVIRIPGELRYELEDYAEIIYLPEDTFSVYQDSTTFTTTWEVSVLYEVDGEVLSKVYYKVNIIVDETIEQSYLELKYDFGEKTKTVTGAWLNSMNNMFGSMGSDTENTFIQDVPWRDATACRWTTCPTLKITKTLYINKVGVLVSDLEVE